MNPQALLDSIKGKSVMVVGDIMLDVFVYGDASRISPEGPVPVLSIARENHMLGGAGNVVANLAALGVNPFLFALSGADENGAKMRGIAKELGADITGLLEDNSRPTTVKTRFLAQGQQLLRSDFEKTHALSNALETRMLGLIEKALPMVQAVILSDYGKGVLTASLIAKVIDLAHAKGLPVLVDPKRHDYSIYKGADIVTPNRKELAQASGAAHVKSDVEIIAAARKIIAQAGIANVVATRSEDGMTLVGADGETHYRAQAREVFDVSGAGDTVIATIAACLAAGADLNDSAHIANIAAGIAVGKVGTTPVRPDEISVAFDNDADLSMQSPVFEDWPAAKEMVDRWKAKGLRVGMTCGCFDILHYGHVNYLAGARRNCDRLVLALNHDTSVKILKGPERPVNDQMARATVLASLASVDMVVFFGAEKTGEDNTPKAVIAALKPDLFFKGGDYIAASLPETPIVESYGGRVEIMNLYEGYSTTATIEKMKNKA